MRLGDMKEKEFVTAMKDLFYDVYMPMLEERIANEVESRVKAVVYHHMREEIEQAIRAQVSKAIRDAVTVNVRVANVSLPSGV